jgi:pilus assembly protein CpaB
VLQNLTVLSAGQDFKQNADGKPMVAQVVNLLVTPRQAEVLSMAGNQTTIQLILRNSADKEVLETPGVTLAGLFGDISRPASPARIALARAEPRPASVPAVPAAPAHAVAPAKEQDRIEIIHGTKRTEVGMTPGEVR